MCNSTNGPLSKKKRIRGACWRDLADRDVVLYVPDKHQLAQATSTVRPALSQRRFRQKRLRYGQVSPSLKKAWSSSPYKRLSCTFYGILCRFRNFRCFPARGYDALIYDEQWNVGQLVVGASRGISGLLDSNESIPQVHNKQWARNST